jgi:hypothetical protein
VLVIAAFEDFNALTQSLLFAIADLMRVKLILAFPLAHSLFDFKIPATYISWRLDEYKR